MPFHTSTPHGLPTCLSTGRVRSTCIRHLCTCSRRPADAQGPTGQNLYPPVASAFAYVHANSYNATTKIWRDEFSQGNHAYTVKGSPTLGSEARGNIIIPYLYGSDGDGLEFSNMSFADYSTYTIFHVSR